MAERANDFRNSRVEETEPRAPGGGGHVAWSATSLMKNVGCGVPRTLVVTEICKHGAALRWFEMDIGRFHAPG